MRGRSSGSSPGCEPFPSSSVSRFSRSAIRSESPLIASAIGSGRWIQSVSGPSTGRPSTLHRVPGVADDGRARRHVLDDDRVGADLGPVADRDRAEQLRAGADRDVVADRRVALAALETGAAEGHPLVERHPVADLRRLADHHAGAVVDEELVADPRRGMDLDPGDGAGQVGDRARQRSAHRPRAERGRRGGRAAPAPRPSW